MRCHSGVGRRQGLPTPAVAAKKIAQKDAKKHRVAPGGLGRYDAPHHTLYSARSCRLPARRRTGSPVASTTLQQERPITAPAPPILEPKKGNFSQILRPVCRCPCGRHREGTRQTLTDGYSARRVKHATQRTNPLGDPPSVGARRPQEIRASILVQVAGLFVFMTRRVLRRWLVSLHVGTVPVRPSQPAPTAVSRRHSGRPVGDCCCESLRHAVDWKRDFCCRQTAVIVVGGRKPVPLLRPSWVSRRRKCGGCATATLASATGMRGNVGGMTNSNAP